MRGKDFPEQGPRIEPGHSHCKVARRPMKQTRGSTNIALQEPMELLSKQKNLGQIKCLLSSMELKVLFTAIAENIPPSKVVQPEQPSHLGPLQGVTTPISHLKELLILIFGVDPRLEVRSFIIFYRN